MSTRCLVSKTKWGDNSVTPYNSLRWLLLSTWVAQVPQLIMTRGLSITITITRSPLTTLLIPTTWTRASSPRGLGRQPQDLCLLQECSRHSITTPRTDFPTFRIDQRKYKRMLLRETNPINRCSNKEGLTHSSRIELNLLTSNCSKEWTSNNANPKARLSVSTQLKRTTRNRKTLQFLHKRQPKIRARCLSIILLLTPSRKTLNCPRIMMHLRSSRSRWTFTRLVKHLVHSERSLSLQRTPSTWLLSMELGQEWDFVIDLQLFKTPHLLCIHWRLSFWTKSAEYLTRTGKTTWPQTQSNKATAYLIKSNQNRWRTKLPKRYRSKRECKRL